MNIESVKISKLKGWKNNPKKHNIDAIVNSMKRWSVTKPVLAHKETMMIIAGHGRVEAMKRLGMTEAPVVFLDMPLEEAKAYALVDNQTTISEGWDDPILAKAMGEIMDKMEEAIELSDYGFDPDALADLGLYMDDFSRGGDINTLADDFQEKRGKATGDEYYFYIEYYGEPERFQAIKRKLKILAGKHQIDSDFFEELVKDLPDLPGESADDEGTTVSES